MADLSEHAVLTAQALRKLQRTAGRHRLNRQLPPDVARSLDDHGLSIASVILPFHERQQLAGDPAEDVAHHRARVFTKLDGDEEPLELFFDVTDADWRKLPSFEAFQRMMKNAFTIRLESGAEIGGKSESESGGSSSTSGENVSEE